jgi:capsular exopolysaccharide synthesis family protein
LSKAEIVSSAGAPVLSEIIYDENEKKIAVLNQYSYIGEQFRELRTKLSYLHGTNEKGRTTLFTSSIAGEGKSFVLHNLGIVLSLAGKKTILLELDLRRPTFLSQFNMDKKSLGLTDYLIGNATKSQIIQPLAISDNLFIIASGNIPPNPSELLEKDELKALINDLKLEFDHILIDSPPVHLLTDAMIVAPMCDVSLYLIRQDYTPKIELEFIKELYMEKKLPRISLIFNAVKNAEYGGGYNYQKNSYIKKAPVKFKNVVKKFFSRF